MLSGDTKVHWIDTLTQESMMGTIEELFQHYSMFVEQTKSANNEIDFDSFPSKILITDMYGWTKIKKVSKIPSHLYIHDCTDWFKCSLANHSFIANGATRVMAYNPTEISKGFHGETKYGYMLKQLNQLSEHDNGRLKRGKDQNGNDIEFAEYTYELAEIPNAGYNIITKSGYYNADNIHMPVMQDGIRSIRSNINNLCFNA